MPSSSSSFSKNVFELLMERDLSKKSMITGLTLSEEIKNKKPVVKKIQKVKSESKQISKPVLPPIVTPSLSNGYIIPKKKTPASTPGAQKASMPSTAVPAAPMPLKKSLFVKKTARITEKMLHKMIMKND